MLFLADAYIMNEVCFCSLRERIHLENKLYLDQNLSKGTHFKSFPCNISVLK